MLMKKLISMVTALALIGSLLTGCQSGSSGQSMSGSSADSAGSAAGNGEKVKISFIDGFTGGDGAYMKKIIDGFNASQDKYEIDELTTADEYVKFKSDDFDMLVIHSDWISTYHGDGLLRELSDVYKAAGISLDDFHSITTSYTKYDDGIYAVPLGLYANTMFYNKKLVKTAPKTYSDLVSLRDQLDSEKSGIYPMAVPLTGDHQWLYMTFLTQYGVNFIKDGHLNFDTEEACNAFLALNKLIYNDRLSPANLGANDHLNAFMKNVKDKTNMQAAVALMGPWNYTAAKEKYGDDLGIAAIPVLGKELKVPAGGHNFAVSSKVTDQGKLDGIAAFFKYAYQPEVMKIWGDAGQTPVHLKTIEYIKQNPDQYPVSMVTFDILDKCEILPPLYNVREQIKYANETVYNMVIKTPNLTKEQLMPELKKATESAAELAQQ
jgi:ABC-type sugar transport system, periplasmic component